MVLLVCVLLLNAGMAYVYSTGVDDKDHSHSEFVKENDDANIDDLKVDGDLDVNGKIYGDGSEIKYLNASHLTSGYLNRSQLPKDLFDIPDGENNFSQFAEKEHEHKNIYYKTEVNNKFLPLSGGTLTGDLYLPNLNAHGIITGQGGGLTNLNASRITNGTIDNARLPNDINAFTFQGYNPSDFAMKAHTHDNRYFTKTEILNLYYNRSEVDSLFGFQAHDHDDRYYSEAEIDTNFYTKSQSDSTFAMMAHTHDDRYFRKSEILSTYYTKVDSDSKFALNEHEHNQTNNTGLVPVGTIIAWAKDLTGVSSLPDGWVECNGQILNDPNSTLNNTTIPDLNGISGDQRFLRGSSISGGTGGASSVASHSHLVFSVNAGSGGTLRAVSGGSGTGYYASKGAATGTGMGVGDLPDSYTQNLGGHDNKPPYYEVVWIMKVL
jgi:hypothetical protein